MVDPRPNKQFLHALADDLNISEAVAALHSLHKSATRGDVVAAFELVSGWSLLGFSLDDVFAFADLNAAAHALDDGEVDRIIDIRLAHIRNKNWPEADRIRDELLVQGIQLKDGKDPQTGERVTTWEVKR